MHCFYWKVTSEQMVEKSLVAKVLISVNHKESFKIFTLQKVGMVLF